jgi:hypothetical protein
MAPQYKTLTERRIRNASIPKGQAVMKLCDGRGLYLRLPQFRWDFDYRFGGKRNSVRLGRYPQMSLVSARTEADKMRRLIARNEDPAMHARITKHAARISKRASQARALSSTTYGLLLLRRLRELKKEKMKRGAR